MVGLLDVGEDVDVGAEVVAGEDLNAAATAGAAVLGWILGSEFGTFRSGDTNGSGWI